MLIIGERINSTLSGVAEAIAERNGTFIQELARRQQEAGAHFLDVNAGSAPGDEAENLAWLVETVQAAVDLPLCLDSANPEAIAAALARHRGRAIVNSITGQPGRAEVMLPVVKRYGCQVVGLTLGPEGMPASAQERVAVAATLLKMAETYGIARGDFYVDPGVMPLSVDSGAAATVLQAIKDIKAALGAKVIVGLSNVSFGLPRRHLLNRTFLAAAMALGLDAAILDPLDKSLIATVVAARALRGEDPYCVAYLRHYRQGLLGPG